MAVLHGKVPNSNFIVYFLDVLSKNIFTGRLECRSIFLEASFAVEFLYSELICRGESVSAINDKCKFFELVKSLLETSHSFLN